jgi:hypothetical protein
MFIVYELQKVGYNNFISKQLGTFKTYDNASLFMYSSGYGDYYIQYEKKGVDDND